uniref:Ig-like domain-containing protein n=1 Tax=Maylandia zebra TaxID=106582 RepID=A0A3P9C430_9CICH
VQGVGNRPTVFPLMPCGSQSGDMVTLACSFLWSSSLTNTIHYPAVQKENVYTGVTQLRVRRQDWVARQTFQRKKMDGWISIFMNMLFKRNPTHKVISSPDEDGTYSASCFAKEFAPKKHDIKWLKNGADVTSKIDLITTVSESSVQHSKFSHSKFHVVSPFLATATAPTVFLLVPCGSESGDMVTLGCLATGFNPPAVTFSWNKGGTALTDFIQYPAVQKGDVYTGVSQVRVRKQDWDTQQNFQCVVNHAAGNAQTPIGQPRKPYLLINIFVIVLYFYFIYVSGFNVKHFVIFIYEK